MSVYLGFYKNIRVGAWWIFLVVDDYETNRCILRCLLEDHDHEVREAENGELAIASALNNPPDLVFMDVMMPVMDGYQATKKIKSMFQDRYLPVIFLTAITNEDALAEALSVGGDDFLVKPFNEEILYAKIQAHARIMTLHEEVSSKNEELQSYKQIMDEERDIAKHVFKTALDQNVLDLPTIESYVSPATTFNGDLLLGVPGPTGNFYLMMADFTGHGLPAAVGAVPLSQAFFNLAREGLSVGDMARALNGELVKILPSNMFCAAVILEQNSLGNGFNLWSGGVPNAYILNENGTIKEVLETLHMPLGILGENDFERDVHVLKLPFGQSIFAFTDGLTEAENTAGEMFGEARLESFFNEQGHKHVDDIISAHTQFMQGQKAEDDITVLRVISGPLELEVEENVDVSGGLPSFGWHLSFSLDAQSLMKDDPVPEYLINMIGAEINISSHKDYLHTILAELYANALEHGVLGLSSKLKDSEDGYEQYYGLRRERLSKLTEKDFVKIDFEFLPGEVQKLKIMFKDSGEGFDYSGYKQAEENDSYGRGIVLIGQLCDSVVYSESGTRVDVVYSFTDKTV